MDRVSDGWYRAAGNASAGNAALGLDLPAEQGIGGSMTASEGQRVVLARRERSMIRYRWTGAEPEGLSDPEMAEELGATWEGDELVTYDMEGFAQLLAYHTGNEYLIDND